MDKWLRYSGILIVLLVLVSPVACNTVTYRITNDHDVISPVGDREEALELLKDVALPTLLVRAEGGLGSAVVFGDGSLALTAAHVVSHRELLLDKDGAPQRDADGRPIYGSYVIEKVAVLKSFGPSPFLTGVTVIKFDPDLDLAVLRLAQVYPYGTAKFYSVEPYLYQKAWISGHPHGVTDTTITEGRIQALWDDGFIRYSALSTFGNSGGPVFLRENGRYRVFSICQRVHTEGFGIATTHMGLGVLPAKMLDFVREYN